MVIASIATEKTPAIAPITISMYGLGKTMNHLSLFSGVGCTELGMKLVLPIKTILYCENDKYCQRVLKARMADGALDEAPIHDDVTTLYSKAELDRRVRTWYNPENGTEYSLEEEVMAGKLKKLTPDQAAECVKMYESGLSLAPIAVYFEVSRQAMWDLLRRRTAMRSQKRFGKDNHFNRGGVSANDKAQNILEQAVKDGIVQRQTHCGTCGDTGTFKDGRTKIQAHHQDYNKPLDVSWICQKCHHKWHKSNKPIRKEVPTELPDVQVDIISAGFP